jgi:hypothetical protein
MARSMTPGDTDRSLEATLLPLANGVRTRRFPFVNVELIAASFAALGLFSAPAHGGRVAFQTGWTGPVADVIIRLSQRRGERAR